MKLQHETTKQIAILARNPGAPIVAVSSPEEGRVMEHIRAVALDQKKRLFTWAVTTGLQEIDLSTGLPQDDGKIENTESPDAAIDHIVRDMGPRDDTDDEITQTFGPPALFVMKDLHGFLEGDTARIVNRFLRDAVAALNKRRQTIILLSPSFQVPGDLKKDVVSLAFPFPTIEEIREQVERFADDLRDRAERTGERIPVEINGGGALVNALRGLAQNEIDSVLVQAFLNTKRLDESAIPYIIKAKQEIINQSPALELRQDPESLDSVGGLDLLKSWAKRTALAYTDDAKRFGLKPPRGAMLVGVPGCGKSLTAKALASILNVPLIRLDFGAVFGSLLGESESAARDALRIVDALGCAVFWWDEIEKGLGGSTGSTTDSGTTQRVFGTYLTWMQETTSDVLVVATANDVGSLPPELYRRFTEIFFVDLPGIEDRREILEIHIEKAGRDPGAFDLDALARLSNGCTGDEIEKAIATALSNAFYNSDPDMTTDHIADALRDTIPLAESMREKITHMREWAKRARPASSTQESGQKMKTNVMDVVEI